MKKKITSCPHCGSTDGFYTFDTYKNIPYRMGFDGTNQDNSEMYENATIYRGKLAYCQQCNKVICRVSTLENKWKGE